MIPRTPRAKGSDRPPGGARGGGAADTPTAEGMNANRIQFKGTASRGDNGGRGGGGKCPRLERGELAQGRTRGGGERGPRAPALWGEGGGRPRSGRSGATAQNHPSETQAPPPRPQPGEAPPLRRKPTPSHLSNKANPGNGQGGLGLKRKARSYTFVRVNPAQL